MILVRRPQSSFSVDDLSLPTFTISSHEFEFERGTEAVTPVMDSVVARFKERFILSLGSCDDCLVLDDELNVLSISRGKDIKAIEEDQGKGREQSELKELKDSIVDTKPVVELVNLARTTDQAPAILSFVDAFAEKTLSSTGHGRGKSAALGLAIAAALAHRYSNIFGMDALGYEEHLDYDIAQSTNPDFNKAIVRVNVFRQHRQIIQSIQPEDAHVLGQAELVIIDEAAAIPLPLVRNLIGPYLGFLASSINGYEGTGHSPSLKLIQQLRESTRPSLSKDASLPSADATSSTKKLSHAAPLKARTPRDQAGNSHPCELFYVSRDALFSLFVLLLLIKDDESHLPEPLVVLQVALEGNINRQAIMDGLSRGLRASGDMVPWLVALQFQEGKFALMSGARVVRIATDPDYVNVVHLAESCITSTTDVLCSISQMGYGARALQALNAYYSREYLNLDEFSRAEPFYPDAAAIDESTDLLTESLIIRSPTAMPPLLQRLTEQKPENLDYLGVSYGLTPQLLWFVGKFSSRTDGYVSLYIRQTQSELAGEHSCVMVWGLNSAGDGELQWLGEFAKGEVDLSVSIVLEAANAGVKYLDASPGLEFLDHYFLDAFLFASLPVELASTELSFLMTPFDLKRLESYAQNALDYHVILDLLPTVVSLYFEQRLGEAMRLSAIQSSLLLGMGLQRKSVEEVELAHGGESLQISAEQGLKSTEDELDEAGGEVTNALREKQRAMIDALDLSR
ncbi:hypothetical protein EW146_g5643 [Bondarzewia mesenterica]|uniref:RNA cytidine acetyltransferase n=1 Tax=Bondarzewia mesenterica TaxID=1095465 RepID=A0A4S4LQU6_9AGAM|nr:hypothetical protein EW146_g5643 [Bondarzewia mesenterica]